MDLDFAVRRPLVRPEDASYPVSVRQVTALLHTSFRRRLAETPLCFANPSPPSGWIGDSHPPAIEHAGHTTKPRCRAQLTGCDRGSINFPQPLPDESRDVGRRRHAPSARLVSTRSSLREGGRGSTGPHGEDV